MYISPTITAVIETVLEHDAIRHILDGLNFSKVAEADRIPPMVLTKCAP